MCVEEAAIIVTGDKEPAAKCTITLTSPVMREENIAEGGKGATGMPMCAIISHYSEEQVLLYSFIASSSAQLSHITLIFCFYSVSIGDVCSLQ